MTREQLVEAFKYMKQKGVKHFGIHAFLASNTVANEYYPALARILFQLAVDVQKETGVHIAFINLSGGVGIPYRPSQEPNDIMQSVKAYIRLTTRFLFRPAWTMLPSIPRWAALSLALTALWLPSASTRSIPIRSMPVWTLRGEPYASGDVRAHTTISPCSARKTRCAIIPTT